MKRFILPGVCLLMTLSGCSTLILPRYIPDKHTVQKNLLANYDEVVAATKKAFKDLGWEVVEEADPAVYERAWQLRDPNVKQVLLLSQYRKSSYLIVSKNTAINAYIRSGADATELELRSLKISTYPFKSFYKYRNKKLTNKLFSQIDKNLNQ